MTSMRSANPTNYLQTDPAFPDNEASIALRVHPQRKQPSLPASPAHHWSREDGSLWMQRHDMATGSLLRLPGLADFLIDTAGTTVDAWPNLGLDPAACHQLYLNNVMPMALSRQGKLVLHASAVEVGDYAIAFVGVSGRGKSTLATHFARSGHALLVDDGLVVHPEVNHFLAIPGDRSVRLWRDSEQLLDADGLAAAEPVGYTGKRRIPAGDGLRFSTQPRPLLAVFLLGLDRQASVSIQRLSPAKAMIELLHHSFLLDTGKARPHAAQMRVAATLASSCTFAMLDYPREYDLLAQVRQAILEIVRDTQQSIENATMD